eukprot:scaffold2584_cov141-Skeletonema_menzelii.AAC.10
MKIIAFSTYLATIASASASQLQAQAAQRLRGNQETRELQLQCTVERSSLIYKVEGDDKCRGEKGQAFKPTSTQANLWFKDYDESTADQVPLNDSPVTKIYDDGTLIAWEACYSMYAACTKSVQIHANFPKEGEGAVISLTTLPAWSMHAIQTPSAQQWIRAHSTQPTDPRAQAPAQQTFASTTFCMITVA